MATGLVDFFKHNLWANLCLLDSCVNLDDEQLNMSTGGTLGNIRETFLHLFASEESYVYRVTGQRPEPSLSGYTSFPGFDELRKRAQISGNQLIALAEQWEPSQVTHLFYQGQSHHVQNIFILIQAINHATEHRAQIATLLGLQNITPPDIDGWAYYGSQTWNG